MVKKIIAVLMLVCLAACCFACNKEVPEQEPEVKEFVYTGTNPAVEITLQTGEKIRLELFPDMAPDTVTAFLALVDADFYNNVVFHRNIENFMIQCGLLRYSDNTYTYTESHPTVKGEFSANGFEANTISHKAGTLSLARTSEMDSGSTQFFITSVDYLSLDGEYAAFGRTIDQASLDVVVTLSKVATTSFYNGISNVPNQNFPIKPIIIKSIERLVPVSE